MHLKRIPLFLALACAALLTACDTLEDQLGGPPKYSRVIETNVRGEWLFTWIAEGGVHHGDEGWSFRAVERHVYNKPDLTIHYPLGRRVTVAAPNVLVEPAEKPEWLESLDAGAERDSQRDRKVSRLHGARP